MRPAAGGQRTAARRWRHVALALAGALAGGCSMRQMIYPAPPVPVPPPPPPLEEVELGVGGRPTIAWHLPADELPAGRPVVLFFHGNGENLETLRYSGLFERWAELGAGLLAVDYPGYGRSAGAPSESANLAAAVAGLDWLKARYPDRPLVACGWSLGAAVAVALAAERPESLAGLVALSPWTSLTDVARAHYPAWMVSLALSESYDSLAAASRIELPALVVHGGLDAIIPASQGRRVAEALQAAEWLEVPGAGHNDLLGRGEVWQAVAGYLQVLLA